MQDILETAETAFRKKAEEEGFSDPVEKSLEADRFNAPHTHEETLFLFILDGKLTVEKPDGVVSAVRGETITVAGGLTHTELAGPHGATLLVTKG
jgi:quercetin dioxygenase-like cupin family protein